jgi:hypothetical protein
VKLASEPEACSTGSGPVRLSLSPAVGATRARRRRLAATVPAIIAGRGGHVTWIKWPPRPGGRFKLPVRPPILQPLFSPLDVVRVNIVVNRLESEI